MMLPLLTFRPMFTVFLVIVHGSRSATNALSGIRIAARQQYRSSSFLVGSRLSCNSFSKTLVKPRSHQNQQKTKHSLSQQQHPFSSSSPSNDGDSNIDTGTTIMGIPTLEQLSTDSFMKQVQYAEFITGLIVEDNGRETDVLMNRLRAQLSHPDGIRGFMVTYLTTSESTTSAGADDSDGTTKDNDFIAVPASLIKAIVEQIDPISDANELISLMCMNVIMPTGMMTMQPNEELSQQSAKTAKRAIQLLKMVLNHCSNNSLSNEHKIRAAITRQCDAILAVATELPSSISGGSGGVEDNLLTYWRNFFQKWGYQSRQQSDIANAIRCVLPE